jgi:hypothetical protein
MLLQRFVELLMMCVEFPRSAPEARLPSVALRDDFPPVFALLKFDAWFRRRLREAT